MKFLKPLYATLLLAALVGGVMLLITSPKQAEANIPPQEIVQIPPFTTGVEDVQIVNASVVDDALEVQIHNNTSRKVFAVLLSSGHTSQGRGVGTAEQPVIAPFGMFTMRFPLANLNEGKPLAVSAVVWEDGTASGYPFQKGFFGREIERQMNKEAQ